MNISRESNLARTAIASAAGVMIALAGASVLSAMHTENVPGAVALSSGTDKVVDFQDISDSAPAANIGVDSAVSLSGSASIDASFVEDNFELPADEASRIAALPEEDRAAAIAQALAGNPAFEVSTDAEGNITVDRPFLMKRLIVPGADTVVDTGSATGAIYDEVSDAHYLSYATMTEAAAAYDELVKQVGEDNIIVDAPVQVMGASASYDGWGTSQMNLDTVEDTLDARGGGAPVTVAVIDSGARSTHEAFADVTFDSRSGAFSSAGSSSATTSDVFEDDNGHGTHVTGIVTASTPDSVSIM